MILSLAALAAAGTERLSWSVTWHGIEAGSAWSTYTEVGDQRRIEAGCRSAPWMAALYPIEDSIRSEWTVGGPATFQSRYREGSFQEDGEVVFGDPIRARRSRHEPTGWTVTEAQFPAVAGVEDPLAAFYRVRHAVGGEVVRAKVWTGKWGTDVRLVTMGAESIAGVHTFRVDVVSEHKSGDVEQATVWYTADADRVPIRVEFRTGAGPVRVTLVERVVTP